MNRRDLLLAMLACSEGRPYTPVQIQKALFLVSQQMPRLVDRRSRFNFEPYDFGPFDSDIYVEAEDLKKAGDVVIAPSATGRWSTYAVSDSGLQKARQLLDGLNAPTREYLHQVSAWVRSKTFSGLVKSIYEAYPNMKENSIFRG